MQRDNINLRSISESKRRLHLEIQDLVHSQMKYRHIRWCFNVANWCPSREDWLKLTTSISVEELERIDRFHYQDDFKSSIIGRALIRKFVSMALGLPSNEIDLERTALGRPVICQNTLDRLRGPRELDFNVSHSGDYCVLAGFWAQEPTQTKLSVGVDVTKIVSKRTRQELDRFLDLMSRREFLPDEWKTVTGAHNDRQKCVNFTRLWCLKESFIKSIGLGLSYKLDRICFRLGDQFMYNLNPKQMQGNRLLNDTRVLIDNQLANDWTFLETALDEEHLVAIGYNYDCSSCPMSDWLDAGSPFEEIRIDRLLEGISPIRSTVDDSKWLQFSTKPNKTRS